MNAHQNTYFTTVILWFSAQPLHTEKVGIKIIYDRKIQVVRVAHTSDVSPGICICWIKVLVGAVGIEYG